MMHVSIFLSCSYISIMIIFANCWQTTGSLNMTGDDQHEQNTVFLEQPLNTAVIQKSLVTLNCRSGIKVGTVQISWTFTRHGQSKEDPVYNGRDMSKKFDRFNISNGDRRCDLVLNQVRMTDAGVYHCEVFSQELNIRDRRSAALIVLASNPVCELTSNSTSHLLNDNDVVRLMCNLTFNGCWAPVMRWRQIAGNPVKKFREEHFSTNASFSSVVTFSMSPGRESSVFSCHSFFDEKTDLPNLTNSIPTYEYNWKSPEMHAMYISNEISLHPLSSQYNPGNIIVCSIDADPPPEYHWENIDTGAITTGSKLTIDDTMVGEQTHTFQCTARNPAGNQSRIIEFSVRHKMLLGNVELIVLVVVGGNVFIILLVVITVVCVRRKQSASRHEQQVGYTTAQAAHLSQSSSESHVYDDIHENRHEYANCTTTDVATTTEISS